MYDIFAIFNILIIPKSTTRQHGQVEKCSEINWVLSDSLIKYSDVFRLWLNRYKNKHIRQLSTNRRAASLWVNLTRNIWEFDCRLWCLDISEHSLRRCDLLLNSHGETCEIFSWETSEKSETSAKVSTCSTFNLIAVKEKQLLDFKEF